MVEPIGHSPLLLLNVRFGEVLYDLYDFKKTAWQAFGCFPGGIPDASGKSRKGGDWF